MEETESLLCDCTNDISVMLNKIEQFTADLIQLENKCKDLEARSWHNIQIICVPEGPNSCSQH